jgi:hypothetical protein
VFDNFKQKRNAPVAKFIARVELHDATYSDYLQLHGFMQQEGFTNTIRGGDGIVYQLPPAEYHIEAPWTAVQARDLASRAAQKTQKTFAVLTSEYNAAAWRGLNKVQMAGA